MKNKFSDVTISRNPLPKRSAEEIKELVDKLMSKMTLAEKIGQMYEIGHSSSAITGPEFDSNQTVQRIKDGLAGSVLGMYDNNVIYALQKCAVEDSRLGIPLLFCNDIIHGCRTMFPHNLAMSCTWEPNLIYEASKVSAYESSHSGVNLTFSPMLDLVRDPRWGRVMESSGEDPYLASVMAKAYVEGYQQDLLSYDSVASCAKHFVGYGAALAGREYNTVDISKRALHQYYLPSFKSAIDSGTKMVMTAFNVVNDVPMTANKEMLRDVLRNQLGFKGVVISDFTSSMEITHHKIAKDMKEVAKKCVIAGLDHEMISTSYIDYLEELVKEKAVDPKLIDEACHRVLTLKYELGLFDNPYKNVYFDFENYWLGEAAKASSLKVALESAVLLKNEKNALPLKQNEKIALIGPLAKSKEVVGAWGGKCNVNDSSVLYDALVEEGHDVSYAYGCDYNSSDKSHFAEALEVAGAADTIVLAIGEQQHMSGEANARSNIKLPGVQEELINELKKLGKKLIVVLFTGRPLDLTGVIDQIDGLLCAWFLGTQSGIALEKLLYGKANPSGKLTMTFPYTVGQVPIFYNNLNTGRPLNKVYFDHYTTRYLDIPNTPLFPFGFGLSYSKFEYSNLRVSKKTLSPNEKIIVSVDVKNVSKVAGKEIVELYIEATCFSVSRPNLELKGFKKIELDIAQTETIEFEIDQQMLAYYNIDMQNITEPGLYNIYVGPSSIDLLKETIESVN